MHGDPLAPHISADGSIVFGSDNHTFRWTKAGGMTDLGQRLAVGGVSADGSVAVASGINGLVGMVNGARGYRWTQASGFVNLGKLPGSQGDWVSANGVSADGSVVVGNSGQNLAFRWTQATGMVDLGHIDPAAPYTRAYATSADGSVVVGWDNGFPFRWTQADGIVPLSTVLDWAGETAWAVTPDGTVIVGGGQPLDVEPAFRWTAATGMVAIGGSDLGAAHAVSVDGSVIVGGGGDAFYWSEATGSRNLRDLLSTDYGLNLSDWVLTDATGISADGRTIVGLGYHFPGGTYLQETWIAEIPEPSTLSLATIAMLGLLEHARRRRNSSGSQKEIARSVSFDCDGTCVPTRT